MCSLTNDLLHREPNVGSDDPLSATANRSYQEFHSGKIPFTASTIHEVNETARSGDYDMRPGL